MSVPVATYRLQFNRAVRFLDARALVPYFHTLGISDLYASPLLQARPGSLHGYDGTDPSRLNSELGTDQEFDALVGELKTHGMGLLLDLVPNHMAASPENPWWVDVLEDGPASPFASYFDIDWHPAGSGLDNRLLLPLLGDPYAQVLENRELTLVLEEGGFFIRYYERRFPLNLAAYRTILSYRLDRLREDLGANHQGLLELERLVGALEKMSASSAYDSEPVADRLRAKEGIKDQLWALYHSSAEMRAFLDQNIRAFNGEKGNPRSFDLLDRLLAHQAYRLAYWRRAADAINYRRFFDVSDLIGLRVENPEVFEATHALVAELVRAEKVTGLRIDHIDGLFDPVDYLQRLLQSVAPVAPEPGRSPSLYVVVEKILIGDEVLPDDWPVCGTTGYEFIHDTNGVFVHPEGLEALASTYAAFTGFEKSFAEVCYGRKKQVMEELFAVEVRSLGQQLCQLAAHDRYACDLPLEELVRVLVEVTACLPVYRTYIRDRAVHDRDRSYIEHALEGARRRTPEGDLLWQALAFLHRVLLLETFHVEETPLEAWLRFVMRWQQFTGPIMAKGLEDTALYVYNRLVSLKEVGTDPYRADTPVDIETFHDGNLARLERWPSTLNATSTHDTKRSEDVRARINVLSEIPGAWTRRLARWSRLNEPHKREVNGHRVPEPNMEILLYQTLIGAWPLQADEVPEFRDRLNEYLIKAAREAKVRTSWIRPNEAYEAALLGFVDVLLDNSGSNEFLDDFLRFQQRVAFYGAFNALGQVVLKIASPGVPDFYQGTELWNFSLVDPDNRRPVDFPKRIRLLAEVKRQEDEGLLPLVRDLLARWEDGRIKLYVTSKALTFRRAHRELLGEGAYLPLRAHGSKDEHLCAFARCNEEAWALVCVPRWLTGLGSPGRPPVGRRVWGETALRLPPDAPEAWHNVLTGEPVAASVDEAGGKTVALHHVFEHLPIALLSGGTQGT